MKPPAEVKVVTLRECPVPESLALCERPEQAAEYWRLHIATGTYFNPDIESLYVLMLNTRRRVKGHTLVSMGTLDTLLVHPREVFRAAIASNASALIVMHSHPSGDPTPSEADIRITRDLIRAGQLLRIEVLDHVVVGVNRHVSLREQGFFTN
jgi:DNA repair protein RadC